MGITDNDIKLIYDILKDLELENEKKDLANRLEIIVKGIEVKDKYLNDMEELNKTYSELNKKED